MTILTSASFTDRTFRPLSQSIRHWRMQHSSLYLQNGGCVTVIPCTK